MKTEIKAETINDKKPIDIAELKCPITLSVFFNPVLSSCNHTFEEEAFKEWRLTHDTCPCCRKKLDSNPPSENKAMKQQVLQAIANQPELAEELYHSDTLLYQVLIQKAPDNLTLLTKLYCAKPEVLNKIGDDKDEDTTLYILASSQGNEPILESEAVREKIDSIALNHIISDGTAKDYSPLYWLTSSRFGQKLLLKDEQLRGKISANGLNHIITEGANKDKSALWPLALTKEGREMLLKDRSLREKIDGKTLNHKITSGTHIGKSVASVLMQFPEGQQILLTPELHSKVSNSILNKEVVPSITQGIFKQVSNLPLAANVIANHGNILPSP